MFQADCTVSYNFNSRQDIDYLIKQGHCLGVFAVKCSFPADFFTR